MLRPLVYILALFIIFDIHVKANAEQIVVDHFVPRDSSIEISQLRGNLRNGPNVLGRIVVHNNTADGFNVALQSENNSALSPATFEDGSEPIPYEISLEKVMGNLGIGIIENTEPILNGSLPVKILDTFIVQESPTHIAYKVILNLMDTSNALKLAGDYSDRLTITYTDY